MYYDLNIQFWPNVNRNYHDFLKFFKCPYTHVFFPFLGYIASSKTPVIISLFIIKLSCNDSFWNKIFYIFKKTRYPQSFNTFMALGKFPILWLIIHFECVLDQTFMFTVLAPIGFLCSICLFRYWQWSL